MDEKIALVSTPCATLTSSKIQHYTNSSIEFKIGLFCTENFSYTYLKQLLMEYEISMEEIEKFRIEKAKLFLSLKDDREVILPVSAVKTVVRKNCHICDDLTAKTSDISAGSIGSDDNYSTVIIRTEKAEKIINDAIGEGYFEQKPITQNQIELLKHMAQNKEKKAQKNAHERENRTKPVLFMRQTSDDEICVQNSEANFDDLKAAVIDTGGCVLCGGCEYVCKDNLIMIDNAKPRKKGKCPADCHLCFRICPRTYMPGRFKYDDVLGEYIKITTLKSTRDYPAQDGGVVTTLLEYMLEKNIITCAGVIQQNSRPAWKPEGILTNKKEEIIKTGGTKYSAYPVFKVLNNK